MGKIPDECPSLNAMLYAYEPTGLIDSITRGRASAALKTGNIMGPEDFAFDSAPRLFSRQVAQGQATRNSLTVHCDDDPSFH